MVSFQKIYEIFTGHFQILMDGAGTTLTLSLLSILYGFLLGIIVALLRGVKFPPVRWIMNAYVEFIRGTPVLVQVLLIVYGLPQLGANKIFGYQLSKFDLSVIALSVNASAYSAEIIRSGIQSVDRGQSEAAVSLGMTGWQRMRYVVFPQAFKVILPTVGNEFVDIIKGSAVLYAIGVGELTYQANKIASVNFRYIETMICAAVIYFVITFALTRLLRMLERRMQRAD